MASTAVITPQPDGSAVFELNGVTHLFGSYEAAKDEADARRIPIAGERVPMPPMVLVDRTAPAP